MIHFQKSKDDVELNKSECQEDLERTKNAEKAK